MLHPKHPKHVVTENRVKLHIPFFYEYIVMATRKHRKSRKSAKRFRRTRSKRQRGGTRDEDIIKAIEDGDTETVTTLMKQKDDDLIIAIYEGDIKTVEMLLKTGSDVNAIDDNGWSALYLASMNGHTDIVAILLENGALPIMSEAEFQECEKQKDEDTGREWVECSISLDEINRFQTVKPLSDPPNNNKVCFK